MNGANQNKRVRNPWSWIPTLYIAEGLPNAVVVAVSVIMYKKLGISNAEIAFYTGWLYLPWVIKPLWSPFVDLFKTKRLWIFVTQILLGAGFAGIALTLPTENFFRYTLAFFWLLAFSSATHDIAVDGFYMLGLSQHNQVQFIGIRSTFYRLATILGQGLLIIFTGYIEETTGDIPFSWIVTFSIYSGFFILFTIYHYFILPYPDSDKPALKEKSGKIFKEFLMTFALFFKKKEIGLIIAFILLYRLGEAQLVKIAPVFLLDSIKNGGIGLTTSEYGFIYGTVGIIALMIGGILGGILASRDGLRYWLFPMLIAINLPDIVYVFLAYAQPESIIVVGAMVVIEQFGYGFGFTAFMLYLIYISEGDYKTSHYAIATGLMALGLMIPGMISGWIQEQIGYPLFFIWVCIATIPIFIVAKFISIDPEFGKKK